MLFISIRKEQVIDLNIDGAISIEFEMPQTIAEERTPSKNILEEEKIGSEIGELFKDSDYKKIAKKIQRYDINKIKKIDNTKPTKFNELFKDKKQNDINKENGQNSFSINKEYYSSSPKTEDSEDKEYLRLIHQKLSQVWVTKPDDAGKRAKISFIITTTGSFTFRVVSLVGDEEFKNRLISSLEKLRLSGFKPPNKYINVTVNFIAKE